MDPLLPAGDVDALRDAFVTASYTVDEVAEALGPAGQAGLARNHTVAADRALAGRGDPLATLVRLFVLQQPVAASAARAALPYDALARAGILAAGPDGVRATIDIRPYGDDDHLSAWVVSDHAATLDTRPGRPGADVVLGVSSASTTLARLTPRDEVGSALDLGTGCGVQALHLAGHARRVTATDLNPRALRLADLTLALSGVTADLRAGSLFEPVAGEEFDLVTTNPPFVMSPPTGERLVYREGSHEADGLMREVVTGGARHLAPGGTLTVLGNWLHVAGEPWTERLAGWVEPTGCDALVLQREVLDLYEYVEIWLADAGLAGTDAYLPAYAAWLDYLDRFGAEAVGMGWVTLRRAGRDHPSVVCEEWPHHVPQPARGIAEQLDAVEAARLPVADLLAARWVLAPGTDEETVGAPGAADPTHLVLRRRTGLGRAVAVDTALAAVLGACDGDLPLQAVVGAVAHLLDADPTAMAADVLPRFRDLVAQGWLTRTGG